MATVNETGRYRAPLIALHWMLAVLIVVMLAIGWTMTTFEHDPLGKALFGIHLAVGLGVLALVLARIAWRLRVGAPPLTVKLPAWQRKAAAASHALLYGLMLGVPLIGLIAVSFAPDGVVILGWALPRWLPANDGLKESLFGVHSFLAATLATLAGLHAAAALKHWLVDRDGVFERMWIRRRSDEPRERGAA